MGTGEIGVPALRALIEHPNREVVAVVAQPDRPVGRKQTLTPPETKKVAEANGIPVHQPRRIRGRSDLIAELDPDVIVVMAYGQILPRGVLDAPRIACLNLHASLLPRHRGAAPIQGAIRDGDDETGITVMYMDEGLDTGDILLAEVIPVGEHTGQSLHDALAELAPVALLRALDLLEGGEAPREPQDESSATHIGKLTRADGRIDWTGSAVEIERLIRAYDPWPGTHALLEGKQLKIYPPTSARAANGKPGVVLESSGSSIAIGTGDGVLEVTDLQLEGKRRMSAEEFLKGRPLPGGTSLG
jgi:methionyl-tRNA formyltransferase